MVIFHSYVSLPVGTTQPRHQGRPFASRCEFQRRSLRNSARPDLREPDAREPPERHMAMPWTLGPAAGHFKVQYSNTLQWFKSLLWKVCPMYTKMIYIILYIYISKNMLFSTMMFHYQSVFFFLFADLQMISRKRICQPYGFLLHQTHGCW